MTDRRIDRKRKQPSHRNSASVLRSKIVQQICTYEKTKVVSYNRQEYSTGFYLLPLRDSHSNILHLVNMCTCCLKCHGMKCIVTKYEFKQTFFLDSRRFDRDNAVKNEKSIKIRVQMCKFALRKQVA